MGESVTICCPYCGEDVEIWIDADQTGTMIQDCEVCCRPWRLTVTWENGEVAVEVGREA